MATVREASLVSHLFMPQTLTKSYAVQTWVLSYSLKTKDESTQLPWGGGAGGEPMVWRHDRHGNKRSPSEGNWRRTAKAPREPEAGGRET